MGMAVESKIGQWGEQLLDLTRRNRLLDLPPASSRYLEVESPRLADLLRHIESDEGSFSIGEGDGTGDPSDPCDTPSSGSIAFIPPARAPLEKVLHALDVQARSALEERGVDVLYLAMGVLVWRGPGETGDPYRTPVLLVPATLGRASGIAPYRLTFDPSELAVNPVLVYALKAAGVTATITVPDLDDGVSLDACRADIARIVATLPGSAFEQRAYLGAFSFRRLSMYRDLESHRELAIEHPLICAFAGDDSLLRARHAEVMGSAPDLMGAFGELPCDPRDSLSVLDADGSQLRAIELAKAGMSFVLQGPPGTGKSQTIANIIAELLGQGKHVLFVSEKRAALEVVHSRLTRCGLGDYCLPLHDPSMPKKDIISALHRSYRAATPPAVDEEGWRYRRLVQERDSLDRYVEELDERCEPMGCSLAQAIDRLAELDDVPDVPFTIDEDRLAKLTWDALMDVRGAGELLDGVADTYLNEGSMQWAHHVLGSNPSLARLDVVRGQLRGVSRLLGDVTDDVSCLEDELGLPSNTAPTLEYARDLGILSHHIADAPPAPERWLDADWTVAGSAERLRRGAELAGVLGIEVPALERLFSLEVLDAPAASDAADAPSHWTHLGRVLRANWADRGRLSRALSGELRAEQARYRPLSVRSKPTYDDLVALTDHATAITTALRELEDVVPEVADLLGRDHLALDADWDALASLLSWTALLASTVPGSSVVGRVSTLLPSCRASRQVTEGRLSREDVAEGACRDLACDVFAGIGFVASRFGAPTQVPMGSLSAEVSGLLANEEGIARWAAVERALACFDEVGLSDAPMRIAERIASDDSSRPLASFADAAEKRVLEVWVDRTAAQASTVHALARNEHIQAVGSFCELDTWQIFKARTRLAARLATARCSAVEAADSVVTDPESRVLLREHRKKSRVIPLRTLFSAMPNLLLTLKPCLMMSPLAVADLLPAEDFTFDALVFDEASQVRPEDAIGAMLRARQVVVVGDSRQLPPTAFFEGTEQTVDEEDADAEVYESILDRAAAAGLPERTLTWHYRSRTEDLIAFSNRFLYDDGLITFPSPYEHRDGYGVDLSLVRDGVYDAGGTRTNAREAARVVELARAELSDNPGRSLGVVALSKAQADLIEARIQQACADDPATDALFSRAGEPFFVKNLENVQGDERDAIILDICYGPDASGHMANRFGPLNNEGGERRLNVAITRARSHLVVVSSFTGASMQLSGAAKEGPRLLKRFLTYAEKGPGVLKGSAVTTTDGFAHSFAETVARQVERMGFEVTRSIGLSGFTVDVGIVDPRDPEAYLLGILCDGAAYRAVGAARDRERLFQSVLSNLGWRTYRMWCADWASNRDAELQRLQEVLVDAMREPVGAPEGSDGPPAARSAGARQTTSVFSALRGVTSLATASPLEVGALIDTETRVTGPVVATGAARMLARDEDLSTVADPYRPWTPSTVSGSPRQREELVNVLRDVVAFEGPIASELLVRRVMSAWDISKIGKRLRLIVDAQAHELVQQGEFDQDVFLGETFYQVVHAKALLRRNVQAAPPESLRAPEQLPFSELSLATRVILGMGHQTMSEAALAARLRVVFGYPRLSRGLRSVVSAALVRMVDSGEMVEESGGYRLA